MTVEHIQAQAIWETIPLQKQQALIDIYHELLAGESKHPAYPRDVVHMAPVVGEEAGELIRAALHATYENGSTQEVAREAIHTGATALRLIINLPQGFYLQS